MESFTSNASFGQTRPLRKQPSVVAKVKVRSGANLSVDPSIRDGNKVSSHRLPLSSHARLIDRHIQLTRGCLGTGSLEPYPLCPDRALAPGLPKSRSRRDVQPLARTGQAPSATFSGRLRLQPWVSSEGRTGTNRGYSKPPADALPPRTRRTPGTHDLRSRGVCFPAIPWMTWLKLRKETVQERSSPGIMKKERRKKCVDFYEIEM